MKKPIVVSMVMAFMLLALSLFTQTHAQDPANEEKPTFYRLTPGVYVNGWPRFTVRYPKEWVERRAAIGGFFQAAPSGSRLMGVGIYLISNPLPLDKYVDFMMPYFKRYATDVTLVSDKPSQLRDGTPAREFEFKMVVGAEPQNTLLVATHMGGILISANVWHKGTIGEDLRAIPYSLQFEPGKDEPVKVPPDVQEFLDKVDNDIVSHDVAKVMANYSDKYLNSGTRKGEMERGWRQTIGLVTSIKGTITDFIPAGDRAYLTGFTISNSFGKWPITDTSIIKENGEWKWYGNQRDVAP
jgi:hypothetical protein